MSTMTLPETLEREFGVFRQRILKGTCDLATQALERQDTVRQIRQDAEKDAELHPDLVALLAALGISQAAVLDQDKLRKRLRVLARRLSVEKQFELSRLLGKAVVPPNPKTLELWVTEQARAITLSVERWLATANEEVRTGFEAGRGIEEIQGALRERTAKSGAVAAASASAAILALNSILVAELASGAGVTHYKWVTEADRRVRENHQPLHNTIQEWAAPPSGGGTKPGDSGHPGSGWGCRCLSVPIP